MSEYGIRLTSEGQRILGLLTAKEYHDPGSELGRLLFILAEIETHEHVLVSPLHLVPQGLVFRMFGIDRTPANLGTKEIIRRWVRIASDSLVILWEAVDVRDGQEVPVMDPEPRIILAGVSALMYDLAQEDVRRGVEVDAALIF